MKNGIIRRLNNRIEQDHQRFCQAFDEVHNYFRSRSRMREFVSPSERRQMFVSQVQQLQSIFQVA